MTFHMSNLVLKHPADDSLHALHSSVTVVASFVDIFRSDLLV